MDIKKIIEMLESMEETGFKGYVKEEKPNGVFHSFEFTEVDEFEMDVQKHLDTLNKSMNKMKNMFPGLLTNQEYVYTANETIDEAIEKYEYRIRVLEEVRRRFQ